MILRLTAPGRIGLARASALPGKCCPARARLVLRGGYGLYYSRIVGQTFFQAITAPPFGQIRISTGPANANASLQTPFAAPPDLSSFPSFRSYSPTTALSVITIAHDYQPPIVQQWGLNLQTQFRRDFLLEVGYVGTRGTKLIRTRELNQASLASVANPIRGVTTNTTANINQRLLFRAFLHSTVSGRSNWEAVRGITAWKPASPNASAEGSQFLASYTFGRSLDSDGFAVETLAVGGTNNGDQHDWRERYGPSNFNRDHRFITSWVYELPGPANLKSFAGRALGGWSLTGVATFQSGRHLQLSPARMLPTSPESRATDCNSPPGAHTINSSHPARSPAGSITISTRPASPAARRPRPIQTALPSGR